GDVRLPHGTVTYNDDFFKGFQIGFEGEIDCACGDFMFYGFVADGAGCEDLTDTGLEAVSSVGIGLSSLAGTFDGNGTSGHGFDGSSICYVTGIGLLCWVLACEVMHVVALVAVAGRSKRAP